MQGIMPPTLDAIVTTASNLDDNAYDVLNKLVNQPSSTYPSDAELARAAKEAGVSEDEFRYFLSFLTFLYAQTSDIPAERLGETLRSFLTEQANIENVDRVVEKLLMLLTHREAHDSAVKRARLAEGLLPNLLDLGNYVDLRNDFERDDEGNLTGNMGTPIPIIQLGIKTNSSKQCERDIVLQLDEKALERLQICIDEIKEKLRILSIKK
jgi:hypothetical protein